MLDHRPHAAREILSELAGCGGAGPKARGHWCACVAGVLASTTVGHLTLPYLKFVCGKREDRAAG
jgi:hypothetical protein